MGCLNFNRNKQTCLGPETITLNKEIFIMMIIAIILLTEPDNVSIITVNIVMTQVTLCILIGCFMPHLLG